MRRSRPNDKIRPRQVYGQTSFPKTAPANSVKLLSRIMVMVLPLRRSANDYLRHYQNGAGLEAFQGSYTQHGHGLGSLLSGLVRKAVPFLGKVVRPMAKRALKSAGRQGLRIGKEVLKEVLTNKAGPAKALSRVGKRKLDEVERKLLAISGPTSPPKRTRIVAPRKKIKQRKRRKRIVPNDIFA